MSATASTSPRRERGLLYAALGGLGITLVAVLLGAAYLYWFMGAQRAANPAQMLPSDTQLYVTLIPSVSNMPEPAQLVGVLRDQVGVADPERVRDGALRLLGVEYYKHLATWIGGTLAVSVRGLDAQGDASAERLLREGEVVFMLGSRNDPQAQAFIEQHLAARMARGEVIRTTQVGQTNVYVQADGVPSPISAFTLFEHYVIFSNRPEAIIAMIERLDANGASLAQVPAFVQFSQGLDARTPGGRYSAGGEASPVGLATLGQLLSNLGEPE